LNALSLRLSNGKSEHASADFLTAARATGTREVVSDAFHTPVLTQQVCDALIPALADAASPRIFVDATCGAGGHAQALITGCDPRVAVLFDRDQDAIEHARARLSPLASKDRVVHFIHAPFAEMGPRLGELGIGPVQAILVDLGVSSHQLDEARRGFSFRHDAPLDMRMDASRGKSAAELLSEWTEREIARVLREYGEESDATRIARAIVATRPRTTGELAEVVTAAMSARQRRALGKRVHPATRTFQAIRIAVNGELEQLDRLLSDAPGLLAPRGRLAIISFHSLEDGRIKRRFRELSRAPELPRHLPLTAAEQPRAEFSIPRGHARGIGPTPLECEQNPRARSSRLRVLERRAP
jgi:16S rRNA (cytosine1402-N4)-methyltransferase